MKVLIDDASLGDLAAIYVWIANDSPDAAAAMLERIFEAIERLGRMPNIGHGGRAKDTLEWVVSGCSYVIVYEIDRANSRLSSSVSLTALRSFGDRSRESFRARATHAPCLARSYPEIRDQSAESTESSNGARDLVVRHARRSGTPDGR